ncbi:FAD-dependent oxidoreductase [Desulfonatronum sp. SC1]|uniref:oxidoreductase n=1 Tax=Desulfonatronum sp. SC1 TaxID=2109626 RepID=UPI000D3131E3|nr:FAD-dependent oxidoreductase [Desulfonatronum sp. SC1]PTN32432.1 NADH:flavin oxidoreductase [Desulfonatronum sp. SC1]
MYKRLQQEATIGRLTLANRVVMPAMGANLGAPNGGVTDDIIAFYEARAKGGVGLIITEITRIQGGAGIGEPCQLAAYRPSDISDLQRLVEAIHKYESRIFIQLQHPGREASPAMTGEQPVAPSPVANPLTGGGVPRELSLEECEALAQKFVGAAQVAMSAGADGVELHGAHGYLINEFLSPAMNFRTDKYGGSFDNRMRFVTEILTGIRQSRGKHFPISVRINAEEALPGGIDLQEACRIAAALEQAGADAINVSCYSSGTLEPGTYAQGWKKYMPAAVKTAVTIPVIAVCNIKEPGAAEALLEQGVCDFVGVGRGHLADPDWCVKAFSGREDEIRTCIGCMGCFGEIVKARRLRCAVNPLTGREREYYHPVKDGQGRVVAVVGGGPAGIEAALALKERGFTPVILDDKQRLGGTLNTADKGYGKEKITRYVDALIAQVEKAGIEVRLNAQTDPEGVKALNPCGVFVACGATPLIPSLPGIDEKCVCVAEDVLLGRVKPTGSVVVIGSGMTGLEAAEMLAMNGCRLTLVEMLGDLGPGMFPLIVQDTMSRITPHDPTILTSHRLERVTPIGVELSRLTDGETVFVRADHVVLAMGVSPRKALVDEFKEAFSNVRVVGDARKGGRILEATQDARGKAFVFDP